VTIDGVHDATYSNYSFGTSFSHTWTPSPSTQPHSATIVVLAGDDLHNVHGYSPTYNLNVPPCQKSSPTLGTTPGSGGLVGTVLNDTATLTGAYSPTGSITFKLYGPTTGTCDTTPIYTQVVALSGVTASTSPGFTTTAVGTYEWTASYPGDQYNNAASSGCGKEAVVITKNGRSISTKLSQQSRHSAGASAAKPSPNRGRLERPRSELPDRRVVGTARRSFYIREIRPGSASCRGPAGPRYAQDVWFGPDRSDAPVRGGRPPEGPSC
jgi:hypothetical protein